MGVSDQPTEQAISGNSEANQNTEPEQLPPRDYLANLGKWATNRPNTKGKKYKARKHKPYVEWRKTPLTQATQLQQAIYRLAEKAVLGQEFTVNDKVLSKELAALVPMWNSIEDRRQVLAGHGKPKPVEASNDPTKQAKRKPSASTGFVPAPKP